ncbi:hypothetical protein ABIB90_007155 [Bradyrhizobium sp. JR4.1]|uniref:hypothetical protein n=1 Tax=Bradyrhizobium sp. JR4.1 TaxID=3156372 RepID=UPI0033917978
MKNTKSPYSIEELLAVVRRLPATTPQAGKLPVGDGYETFQEQWIGWLEKYDGPGYYGRKDGKRDAQWVYQHLNNGKMIVWLNEATGESPQTIEAAVDDLQRNGSSPQTQAKIARLHLPWNRAAGLLFT